MVAARGYSRHGRRCVVVALPEAGLAAAVAERLRQRGWRVYRAATPAHARRLAWQRLPEAVILPADGFGESGWLTCAKLMLAQPHLRVLLVGDRTPYGLRCARFLGAAGLVPADAGAAELVARIEAPALQAV